MSDSERIDMLEDLERVLFRLTNAARRNRQTILTELNELKKAKTDSNDDHSTETSPDSSNNSASKQTYEHSSDDADGSDPEAPDPAHKWSWLVLAMAYQELGVFVAEMDSLTDRGRVILKSYWKVVRIMGQTLCTIKAPPPSGRDRFFKRGFSHLLEGEDKAFGLHQAISKALEDIEPMQKDVRSMQEAFKAAK